MDGVVQVNYEELKTIAKAFRARGELVIDLHAKTLQMVHDIQTEWIGQTADAFSEEMETVILPRLKKIAEGLFFGEEVIFKILNLFHESDTETANFFKRDLQEFIRPPFSVSGGIPSGGLNDTASFNPDRVMPGAGQPSSSGAGTTGSQAEAETSTGNPSAIPTGENGTGSSGAGAGSGGGGNLNGLGGGLGSEIAGDVSGISGASSPATSGEFQDHISANPTVPETTVGPNAPIGGNAQTNGGNTASAAGAAVAGAAVLGTAGKVLNDKKKK